MARNLTSIPDIQAPDGDYPNGRIQNEDSPIVGTPVVEELYGDIIQFFHKLMRVAGLSHNGLPENETQGFQFITALQSYIRTVTSSTSQRGVSELADNAETQAGIDGQRVVTPLGLSSRTATEIRTGLAELATILEAKSSDTSRIITGDVLSYVAKTKMQAITSNGTYNINDNTGIVLIYGGTGTVIVRFPANSTLNNGWRIRILNVSGYNVTIQTSSGGVQYPTTINDNYIAEFEYYATVWYCVNLTERPIA